MKGCTAMRALQLILTSCDIERSAKQAGLLQPVYALVTVQHTRKRRHRTNLVVFHSTLQWSGRQTNTHNT